MPKTAIPAFEEIEAAPVNIPDFDAIEPERIPLGNMSIGSMLSGQQAYDELKAKTIGRPKQILSVSKQTGVPVEKVADIHNKLDNAMPPWWRSWGSPDMAPLWNPSEANTVASDVADAIKESPDNLYIGGMMFSEGILDAIQWHADQFEARAKQEKEAFEKVIPLPPEGTVKGELGRMAMPGQYGIQSLIVDLADKGAEWLRQRTQAKLDAQMKVTLENAPITAVSRMLLQQGVPSAGVAISMSLVTGSPAAGLVTFFESTGGKEYQEQRAAGASFDKANLIATLSGAAEVGGEMLVFPKFIPGLKQGIPFRNAVKLIAENYGQEFATGFTQTMLSQIGKKTSAGMSIEEAAATSLDEAWDNAKQSGLVGAGTAGLIDVASIPTSYYLRASEIPQTAQVEQPKTSEGVQTFLQQNAKSLTDEQAGQVAKAQAVIQEVERAEETTTQTQAEAPAGVGQTGSVAESAFVAGSAAKVAEGTTEVNPVPASEPQAQSAAAQNQQEAAGTPGGTTEADTAYKKMRSRELAKTTRYIKQSMEYQAAEEEAKAKGFTTTGVSSFYVEPKYRGDVEAAFGEKGKKGSNKAAWAMITFDKSAGQGWDQAQQELSWGTTFDEFLSRVGDFAEGDIAPDVLDVAQASGNIDLETAALKRSMLQNGRSARDINAAIEENVKGGQQYLQLSDEDVDAIIEAHRIKMAGGETAVEYEESIGAAKGNFPSRRRAIDRAQKMSRETGQPAFVVQRANGTYAALTERPKKGHYTYVDMKAPLAEQVQFVKQASATAEESFDYAEHPKESQKHLSELERFKARLKDKTAQAKEIAAEMWDYIKANVPAAQQSKFVPLLSRTGPNRATKYNLQDLMRAIAKTEEILRGNDKRAAIDQFKKVWSKAKARLKEMDQATRAKLESILGDVDLAKLSEGKKEDLASLAKHLNRIAEAVAQGQMEEAAAREAVMSIPRARIEALQRLGRTPLSEMTAEDIRSLAGEIQSFIHQYDLKNKLVGKRKAKARAQALAETVAEVTPLPSAEEPTTETGIFRQGQLARFFTSASAHLDTLVERITRPGDTTTMRILVKDIWDGWRVRSEIRRDATRMLKQGTEQIGFTAEDFEAMSDPVEVIIGGKPQNVTRWELLSLYMHAKDDSNVREILRSTGLEFNGVTVTTFTSYVEMADALNALTPKEQAVGDLFTEINSQVLAPAINKASMELEGRELADNPNYWRRGRVFPKSVAGRIADVAIEDTGPFQPRTGGKAPIEIVPFHVAAAEAIDAASTYGGTAVPLYNARSIVNTAEWQNAVKTAGYEDAMDAMFTLYRRMQAYGTETGIIDSMGKKLLTRFGASRLSLRISSMVGQYAGIPVAATEIPVKYLAGVKPNRKLLERAMERSAVLENRWANHHMNLEAGNMALLAGYKGMFFGEQPLLDKPLNLLALADGQVGSIMAGAIVRQLKDEQPSLQGDALDQEVADRLEYAIRRTQGSWDIVDRSVMLSDTTLASRVMGMFRTAMEAQWNVMLRAVNRYQKSQRTTADKEALAVDLGLVTTGAFVESTLKIALKAIIPLGAWATLGALGLTSPDDEPEENDQTTDTLAKLATRTGENLLAVVPGGNWMGGLLTASYKATVGANKTPAEPMAGALESLREETFAIIPDGIQLGRHLVTGETYANRDDDPKWHTDATRLLFKIGDVVSMYTGAPFSGPVSEFREPAALIAGAVRAQTMTTDELVREIRANTYGRTAKKHAPGAAHEGKEKYVNMLKTELGKRQ